MTRLPLAVAAGHGEPDDGRQAAAEASTAAALRSLERIEDVRDGALRHSARGHSLRSHDRILWSCWNWCAIATPTTARVLVLTAAQCAEIVAGFARIDGSTVKHEHIDHFMMLLNVRIWCFSFLFVFVGVRKTQERACGERLWRASEQASSQSRGVVC